MPVWLRFILLTDMLAFRGATKPLVFLFGPIFKLEWDQNAHVYEVTKLRSIKSLPFKGRP